MRRPIRTLVVAAAVLLPFPTLQSQANTQRARASRGASASELISARRALNLTPQQLVRLDSMERAQFAARDRAATAARASRDSLCANRRPCVLSRDELQALRGNQDNRMARGNMFAADSARRAMTMSVLDSSQRARFVALQGQRGRTAARPGARAQRSDAIDGRRGMFRGQDNSFRGRRNDFRGQRNDLREQRGNLRGQRNSLRGKRIAPRGMRDDMVQRQSDRNRPNAPRRAPQPRRPGQDG